MEREVQMLLHLQTGKPELLGRLTETAHRLTGDMRPELREREADTERRVVLHQCIVWWGLVRLKAERRW